MRIFPSMLAPLALLLALQLVACGNKGPLVRPGADDVEATEAIDEADEAADGDAATAEPVEDEVPTDADAEGDDPAQPSPTDDDDG